MIPVYQQFKHDPANRVYGDCMRASLASVMNLPIEKVPHFARDTWCEAQQECTGFWHAVEVFLNDRDLHYVLIHVTAESSDEVANFIRNVGLQNPDVYYLAGVRSKRDINHMVVCIDGEVVHDPYPSEEPIDMANYGPMSSGGVDVMFLIPKWLHCDFDHAGRRARQEALDAGRAALYDDVVDAEPCSVCMGFDCNDQCTSDRNG